MIDIEKARDMALERKGIITNDELLEWAGGTDEEWRSHLNGPKVAYIASQICRHTRDQNKMLASEGIGSKQWRMVTCGEYHRRRAEFNLRRVDGHYRNAHADLVAISTDVRVPETLQEDAEAWLSLFEEATIRLSLEILRDFAGEIIEMARKHIPLEHKEDP